VVPIARYLKVVGSFPKRFGLLLERIDWLFSVSVGDNQTRFKGFFKRIVYFCQPILYFFPFHSAFITITLPRNGSLFTFEKILQFGTVLRIIPFCVAEQWINGENFRLYLAMYSFSSSLIDIGEL